MTFEPYPNDDDRRQLVEAQDLLATSQIMTGRSSYDVDTLAAAVYAQGWAYRIDRAAGISGYRVELRPQHGTALQPFASAVGWDLDVALTFALAQAVSGRA